MHAYGLSHQLADRLLQRHWARHQSRDGAMMPPAALNLDGQHGEPTPVWITPTFLGPPPLPAAESVEATKAATVPQKPKKSSAAARKSAKRGAVSAEAATPSPVNLLPSPVNLVRRTLDGRTHVQINCPQRTSCTLFARHVCALMRAEVCKPDHTSGGCFTPVPPVDNRSYVVKTTIMPYRTLDAWAKVASQPLYRIAFFRNPVDQLASIADEAWKDNCGGFQEKFKAYDVEAMKAMTSPYYDAVIFAENWYNDTDLLQAAGFPPVARKMKKRLTGRHPKSDYTEAEVCAVMPFLCTLATASAMILPSPRASLLPRGEIATV